MSNSARPSSLNGGGKCLRPFLKSASEERPTETRLLLSADTLRLRQEVLGSLHCENRGEKHIKWLNFVLETHFEALMYSEWPLRCSRKRSMKLILLTAC